MANKSAAERHYILGWLLGQVRGGRKETWLSLMSPWSINHSYFASSVARAASRAKLSCSRTLDYHDMQKKTWEMNMVNYRRMSNFIFNIKKKKFIRKLFLYYTENRLLPQDIKGKHQLFRRNFKTKVGLKNKKRLIYIKIYFVTILRRILEWAVVCNNSCYR